MLCLMHTKPTYEELEELLARERAIAKAACVLADRYKSERDGARAETIAVKSKVADAGHEPASVRYAIQQSLEHPTILRKGGGTWSPSLKASDAADADPLNPGRSEQAATVQSLQEERVETLKARVAEMRQNNDRRFGK
jgi:hypothetical protein